ncbi:AMP-binding protein [Planktotalea sp.]|uniref:AMP-binding protein n=1 Tax=Planktotalea sp. TaxID=2029877 RepID=UPI0025DC508C|nr:AMP-binding protein [Planktotalea sp.]
MQNAIPTYAQVRATFEWDLPDQLNMAAQCLAHPPAQIAVHDLVHGTITYAQLEAQSAALAQVLIDKGIRRGDRVGVLRSQDVWTAAAHLAIWSLGAISVPLFTLFQADALDVRTLDAGLSLIITDQANSNRVMHAPALVPDALPILANAKLTIVDTGPETPACLIYTSGTTGAPKGALHGHRMLTGHLPGVVMSHDALGQPDDCLWSPADWAWIGGLFDVLMPGLALGVPVVAARLAKFNLEGCLDVLARAPVRNVFFPPTALRMLKAGDLQIKGLRSVASGGEPLGTEMLEWGKRAFGLNINEFYGQTECNMVASSSSVLFEPRANCIGKPVAGFEIEVLNEAGTPTLDEGDVAIRKGAASMMLDYWDKPEASAQKFKGDWMLTGDRGIWEGEYLRFVGREDDVITSSGYRIGPSEIEDCLLSHPCVATVGVIGKPDALRTEIVKAYIVLKEDVIASSDLVIELQVYVKQRLASYSYPREIEFLSALPMTVTGKVIRRELKARARAELKGAP